MNTVKTIVAFYSKCCFPWDKKGGCSWRGSSSPPGLPAATSCSRPPKVGWILPCPLSPLLLTPPSHIKGTLKNIKGYTKAGWCFPSQAVSYSSLVLFVLHPVKQSQTQNFMLNSKKRRMLTTWNVLFLLGFCIKIPVISPPQTENHPEFR